MKQGQTTLSTHPATLPLDDLLIIAQDVAPDAWRKGETTP